MTATSSDGHVPSPCISVCAIDEVTGLCTGCLRTLDEIAVWSVLDDAEKRDVQKQIHLRRNNTRRLGDSPKTGTDADR